MAGNGISRCRKIGESFSSSVEICRKTFPAGNLGQPQPSRVSETSQGGSVKGRFWPMCLRSGFCTVVPVWGSRNTGFCTLVPVLVPSFKNIRQNRTFGNHPLANPPFQNRQPVDHSVLGEPFDKTTTRYEYWELLSSPSVYFHRELPLLSLSCATGSATFGSTSSQKTGKVNFCTGTGRKAFFEFFRPDSGPPPVHMLLQRKKANSFVPAIFFPMAWPF